MVTDSGRPMTSDFLSVITARHCKRAFLDRPVPRAVMQRVLTAAGHAPSPRNTQLWEVAVVTGAAREELSARLCAALDAGDPAELDYANRPDPLGPGAKEREFAWGSAFYGTLGVDRGDAAARKEFIRRNLRFYGAPVAMIFHLPRNAVPGTFLEMGFFLQNVMLGLVAYGLGSCPQSSVATYSGVIREFLGLGPDRLVVCGMSAGFPDEADPINRFHPRRAPLHDYTRWYDAAGAGQREPDATAPPHQSA